MRKVLKREKGFTLIELMVVMAIIAVLAVLLVAAIQAARSQSITTQRTGNVKSIETALEAYAAATNNQYPLCGGVACTITTLTADTGPLRAGNFLSQALPNINASDYLYTPTAQTGYTLQACRAGNTAAPAACTGSAVAITVTR